MEARYMPAINFPRRKFYFKKCVIRILRGVFNASKICFEILNRSFSENMVPSWEYLLVSSTLQLVLRGNQQKNLMQKNLLRALRDVCRTILSLLHSGDNFY